MGSHRNPESDSQANERLGEYQDRRNLEKVNCSKTIWILATNAHDAIIQDFTTNNGQVLFAEQDEREVKRLLKQLSYQVREDFRAHHGVSGPTDSTKIIL